MVREATQELNMKYKSSSFAFSLLVSINAVAGAIGISGVVVVLFSVVFCFALFDWNRKINNLLLLVIVASIYALSSYLIGNNSSALAYGVYCIVFGILLFGLGFKVNVISFFHYLILINLFTGLVLLFRVRSMSDPSIVGGMEPGTMMGISYAIVPVFLLCFSYFLCKDLIFWRILSLFVSVIDLYIIVTVGSRGVFVIIGCFFILLIYRRENVKLTRRIIFLLMLIILITTLLLNLDSILNSIVAFCSAHNINIYAVRKTQLYISKGNLDNGRLVLWRNAWEGIVEQPFGHLVSSFDQKYGMHQHNLFLQLVWEFGIIGLLLFFILLCKSIATVFKRYSSKMINLIVFSIFCSSIVLLLYSASFWNLTCFWIWFKIISNNRLEYLINGKEVMAI